MYETGQGATKDAKRAAQDHVEALKWLNIAEVNASKSRRPIRGVCGEPHDAGAGRGRAPGGDRMDEAECALTAMFLQTPALERFVG